MCSIVRRAGKLRRAGAIHQRVVDRVEVLREGLADTVVPRVVHAGDDRGTVRARHLDAMRLDLGDRLHPNFVVRLLEGEVGAFKTRVRVRVGNVTNAIAGRERLVDRPLRTDVGDRLVRKAREERSLERRAHLDLIKEALLTNGFEAGDVLSHGLRVGNRVALVPRLSNLLRSNRTCQVVQVSLVLLLVPSDAGDVSQAFLGVGALLFHGRDVPWID